MKYSEALAYLNSLTNYEQIDSYDYNNSFNLNNMLALTEKLGNPERGIRSIHVAGSKGKGSTANFIYSVLKDAGYRVGLYTSPHLSDFRERIRVCHKLISKKDFSRHIEKLHSVLDKNKIRLTFFEMTTAIAFLHFKETKVDFAVYEVGLGGRLDATNVIKPLVSVITPISLEHTQKLGRTISAIAAEKAGIIKKNGICISSPQEEEALDVIRKRARSLNSTLILTGEDVCAVTRSASPRGSEFSVKGPGYRYGRIRTTMSGYHQIDNATTAIAAIKALALHGIGIDDSHIRNGISQARWPGRLEMIKPKPLMIVDGAQNRASCHSLAKSIRNLYRYKKLTLVLGISNDKDALGIVHELSPMSDKIIVTQAAMPTRAMKSDELIKYVLARKARKSVILTENSREALLKAEALSGIDDIILITGSLFLVGEVRRAVKEIDNE